MEKEKPKVRGQKTKTLLAAAALLVALAGATSLLWPQTFLRSAEQVLSGVFDQTLTASSLQTGTLRVELYFGTNTDFNAAPATSTQTSTAYANPEFFKQAELYATWAGITGAPAGCTLQVQGSGDSTTFINSGSTVAVTPGTNVDATFSGALGQAVRYVYACTTYPTAGTLTLKTVYK